MTVTTDEPPFGRAVHAVGDVLGLGLPEPGAAETRARALLHLLARDVPTAARSGGPRRSTLTPDGTPLEVAVSTGRSGAQVRYIVDAGDLRRPVAARVRDGVTEGVFSHLGLHAAVAAHGALAGALLGPDTLRGAEVRFGVWLSPQHHADGTDTVRVYYNLAPFRRRVPGGARAVLGALADVVPVAHLGEVARLVPLGLCPALLGVEYGQHGARKAKWYFRACQGLSLARLERLADRCGSPGGPDALRTFTAALLGGSEDGPEHPFPERAVLLYLSHDQAGRVGLNVYLPGRAAGPDERDLARRVAHLHRALGLDPSTYGAVLARLRRGAAPEARLHTLTGLKLGAGDPCVNQYLCPAP